MQHTYLYSVLQSPNLNLKCRDSVPQASFLVTVTKQSNNNEPRPSYDAHNYILRIKTAHTLPYLRDFRVTQFQNFAIL